MMMAHRRGNHATPRRRAALATAFVCLASLIGKAVSLSSSSCPWKATVSSRRAFCDWIGVADSAPEVAASSSSSLASSLGSPHFQCSPAQSLMSSGAATLLAASLTAGLLASTTCPSNAMAAASATTLANDPRAVRIDFVPGDDPKLDARSLARILYSDRTEFMDAAREVRAAMEQVGRTLGPAVEDLAGRGSSVSLSPPRDVRGAVRDALSGRAAVVVNGEAVGVAVTSEEGALDVRITSRLLPRIPFQTAPAATTTLKSSAECDASIVEYVAPPPSSEESEGVQDTIGGAPYLWDAFVSFLGSPFYLNRDITNAQAGQIALIPGTAAVYGISYQYYIAQIEQEAEMQRQKNMSARKGEAKKTAGTDSDSGEEETRTENQVAGKDEKEPNAKQKVPSSPAPTPATASPPTPTPIPPAPSIPAQTKTLAYPPSTPVPPASTPRPSPVITPVSAPIPVQVEKGSIALKRATSGTDTKADLEAVANANKGSDQRRNEEASIVDGKKKENDDDGTKSKRRLVFRLLKKVVMPWKPFSEL